MSDLRLLMGLNEAQLQAVTSDSPKILCLAGAGSGKTRVLTHRVARLVGDRIGANNILCLTFTRLAGKEMKERLIPLIGERDARKVFCNTFHAFAVQILKESGAQIDVPPNFVIYDQDDRADIMQEIINELNAKTNVKKVLEAFPSPWFDYKQNMERYEESMVTKEYLYRCAQYNAIDLDALIPYVNHLFKKSPIVLSHYRNKYTHVFVDEFQDTSDDQMELLSLLNPPNLFVVGDDYQAIYGWRGAKVEYILKFAESALGFGAETIVLEDNYRSTKQIVQIANRSIAVNQKQHKKQLRAHKDGAPVKVKPFALEPQEFSGVISEITGHIEKGVPMSEIAVLARTNLKLDTLKSLLDEMKIPAVKLATGDDILAKPDIKKILSWMSLLSNIEDESALKRAINWPQETISPTDLKKAELRAKQEGKRLGELVITPRTEHIIDTFYRLNTGMILEKGITGEDYNAATWFRFIVQILGLKNYYAERKLNTRIQDLVTAYDHIWEWFKTKQFFGEDFSPEAFLRWLKYRDVQEKLMGAKQDAVRLMTVHASKGLEFTAVILMGMSSEEFPSPRGRQNLEEERRLFYVAVTRAKEHLTITYANEICSWNGAPFKALKSLFLGEIS